MRPRGGEKSNPAKQETSFVESQLKCRWRSTRSNFGGYLEGRKKFDSLASNRLVTLRIRSYNEGDRALPKWRAKSTHKPNSSNNKKRSKM